MLLLAALAIAPAARLHAQPASQHEPQETREVQSDSTAQDDSTGLYTRIRLSSLTINGTFLPRAIDPTLAPPYVYSMDALLDLDMYSTRSTSDGMSSAIGLRLGAGWIAWTVGFSEYGHNTYHEYHHIRMQDLDLLSRYSVCSSRFRLDVLLGLTTRFGDHPIQYRTPFSPLTVRSTDAALKLGAGYSFALWNPVLSFHIRAGCVLFGYEPIEAASIGIGLSLGYQRCFQSVEQ